MTVHSIENQEGLSGKKGERLGILNMRKKLLLQRKDKDCNKIMHA